MIVVVAVTTARAAAAQSFEPDDGLSGFLDSPSSARYRTAFARLSDAGGDADGLDDGDDFGDDDEKDNNDDDDNNNARDRLDGSLLSIPTNRAPHIAPKSAASKTTAGSTAATTSSIAATTGSTATSTSSTAATTSSAAALLYPSLATSPPPGLAVPDLASVVEAALRASGVADDPVPSWRRRSRWSALVPAISARIGNSQSWRVIDDPTVNRAASYAVGVAWRLDQLVYDPNEPRFTAFDMARRRERRRVIEVASHAYVVWLDAHARIVAALADSSGAPDGPDAALDSVDPAWLIQAQRAHIELDALTDGWFSETVGKLPGSQH